jgi:peroxiredoxin
MPQVSLNTPAPDFALKDFRGEMVRLADYRGKTHVLLVFNRGFV